MQSPHADVAELADAQVSEACDGDIVEVQVLSSAPGPKFKTSPKNGTRFYFYSFWNKADRFSVEGVAPRAHWYGVASLRPSSKKKMKGNFSCG
jgi:hypothetical protein